MSSEENRRRKTLIFRQLSRKVKRKTTILINAKSEPAENVPHELRAIYIRDPSFKQKQQPPNPSTPSINTQPTHNISKTHSLFSNRKEHQENPIIHDTFSHILARKSKLFNIKPSSPTTKDKPQKHGLLELANQLAHIKPLGAKQSKGKSEEQQKRQKRLRRRNYNKQGQYPLDESPWFRDQENLFRRGPDMTSSSFQPLTTIDRQSSSLQERRNERLKPWHQNEECPPLRQPFTIPYYHLSDILQ